MWTKYSSDILKHIPNQVVCIVCVRDMYGQWQALKMRRILNCSSVWQRGNRVGDLKISPEMRKVIFKVQYLKKPMGILKGKWYTSSIPKIVEDQRDKIQKKEGKRFSLPSGYVRTVKQVTIASSKIYYTPTCRSLFNVQPVQQRNNYIKELSCLWMS